MSGRLPLSTGMFRSLRLVRGTVLFTHPPLTLFSFLVAYKVSASFDSLIVREIRCMVLVTGSHLIINAPLVSFLLPCICIHSPA